MATRMHVDSSVNERRLRPIYDYLDNGNYKKALQEAEKLLKKQKDFQCAKVLKGLALVRLGRTEDSATALNEVHSEAPTDDPTLQAMTICYRELERPDLIVDIYENAAKKEPQNEELLSHLFMAYVRLGDYKKQRQAAMSLHKLKQKNPYYFWAVMSIVMEASNEIGAKEKSMLLLLAERMVEKFVKENRIEAEAEVLLYLMILEMQGKFQEALDVLNGPLGENMTSYIEFLPQRKAELLTKLEKWPEVNSLYKSLLIKYPDQWSYHEGYLNSLEILLKLQWLPDGTSSLDPPADYNFTLALEFVRSLIKAQEERNPSVVLRGPYLANMEVLRRGNLQNSSGSEAIGDLLIQYFKKLGHKGSCFLDMCFILERNNLPEEEKDKIVNQIEVALNINKLGEKLIPSDVNELQRHMCLCQLKQYVGKNHSLSRKEKLDLVEELFLYYENGLKFGADLLQTDFQPADTYVLLAANLMADLWEETGDHRILIQLIVALEKAVLNSPSSFQLKLWLLKIYSSIGAIGPSISIVESLDIKHILNETLGYLITPALLKGAHFTVANVTLANTLKFFTGNYKDTVDYLISCYKFGSFTKIQEMINFREKLNNSLQYANLTVEKMVLELMIEAKSHDSFQLTISCMEIDPVKDKTVWSDLTDNRDIKVFRTWNSYYKPSLDEIKAKTFQEEVNWLKLRNLLLRCVASAYYLTQPKMYNCHSEITNGEKQDMSIVMEDLLASLKEHITQIDCQSLTHSWFPLQVPGPSRLRLYLTGGYLKPVIALLQLVLSVYRLTEGNLKAELPSKESVIEALDGLVTQIKNKKLTDFFSFQEYLEEFVNLVEVITWCTVLLNIGFTLLRPVRTALSRKGKKKKNNLQVDVIQSYVDIITHVANIASDLVKVLQDNDISSVTSLMSDLEITTKQSFLKENTGKFQKQTKDKIESSYQESFRELKDVLVSKIKYLQSLHL